MTTLVFYLLVFLVVGVFFLFIHLVIGRLLRPVKPDAEKLTIYECGEPTIGSAWVQFDLRYYVIALLFVIFDVEVAFFFPWATVFGKSTTLAQTNLPDQDRIAITKQLTPASIRPVLAGEQQPDSVHPIKPETAHRFAWLAMLDIAVFFGVLLVGFAYLWRRGDLNWVRSTAAERVPTTPPRTTVVTPPVTAPEAAAGVPAGQSV
jgi:NADH-quinone oxidoreductase subunit A